MTPDWAGTPYSRVYHQMVIDHPEVWDDDRLLAWWVRLLVEADSAFPRPASLPRGAPDDVLESLAARGILERSGDRFWLRGLAAERDGRRHRGIAGGLTRAATAARDDAGRFAGTVTLGLDAGADAGAASVDAGAHAGVATLELPLEPSSPAPSEPARPRPAAPSQPSQAEGPTTPDLRLGSSPSRAPMREGRGAPTEGTIRCDDYRGHATTGHQLIAGVGWRCVICEAAWAADDESFGEKVRRYGDVPF